MEAFYGILIPFFGNVAGRGVRILYEKNVERPCPALADRLRCRCDGGRQRMEPADPCH